MKFNSLRVKVIGVVLVCLMAAAAIILLVFRADFARESDQIARDAVTDSRRSFQNMENDDINKMAAVLQSILANDGFARPHTAANRDAVLAQAQPLFELMKNRYHFTLWNFHDPESLGTIYLRMQNPGKFGDPVQRWMYNECVRTKAPVVGKELANSGFGLRVMMPQMDRGGNLLGYVEVGEELGRFLATMHAQTGNEYGLALKKSMLQRDKWTDARKLQGKKDPWDDLRDIVLADRTTDDDQLLNVQIDIDSIPAEGEVLGEVTTAKGTYVRGVFPLISADGKRSGAVFVARDMTAAFARLRAVQQQVAGVILAVMVSISLIIAFMLRSWVFRRLDHMIEIATRVVGGDYECEIKKSANDEVGEFEYLFDQFRKVFLSVVKSQTQEPVAEKV
jgi:HAMP domain-containing protein